MRFNSCTESPSLRWTGHPASSPPAVRFPEGGGGSSPHDGPAPGTAPLFAVAIYTGLRKGELLALRREDVDLEARRPTVARSHDRDTTKGNRVDVIPMADEAVPSFQQAIAASPSGLLFRHRTAPCAAGTSRPMPSSSEFQAGPASSVAGHSSVGARGETPRRRRTRPRRSGALAVPCASGRSRSRAGCAPTTCAAPAPRCSSSPGQARRPWRASCDTQPRTSSCSAIAHMDPTYLREELNTLSFAPVLR